MFECCYFIYPSGNIPHYWNEHVKPWKNTSCYRFSAVSDLYPLDGCTCFSFLSVCVSFLRVDQTLRWYSIYHHCYDIVTVNLIVWPYYRSLFRGLFWLSDHQKLEREARICRLLKHPNIGKDMSFYFCSSFTNKTTYIKTYLQVETCLLLYWFWITY